MEEAVSRTEEDTSQQNPNSCFAALGLEREPTLFGFARDFPGFSIESLKSQANWDGWLVLRGEKVKKGGGDWGEVIL